MYDIRQFRPTLYLLLMLGITGFCFSAAAPGLWLLSGLGLGLHYFLRERGVRTTLPSWAAALAALGFGLLTFKGFMIDAGNSLLVAGQFLVLLQLVKLYQEGTPDHRAENRNYAWLLVLSLLLMVAASISTASMVFGAMLVSYLVLSLFCCLLFHLKVEAENAKAAMTIPKDAISPAQLRQTETSLPRSMRRLTALVAGAGLTLAIIVFLFFPRGAGQGLFGQMSFRPSQALTGFSEQVSFNSVARITQSNELVARVEWTVDGQVIRGSRPLYLRGVTLDAYSGHGKGGSITGDTRPVAAWLWQHAATTEVMPRNPVANQIDQFAEEGGSRSEVNVKLEPTGSSVIFVPSGVHSLTFTRDVRYNFFPTDETARLGDALNAKLEYTAMAREELGYRPRPDSEKTSVPRVFPASPSRIDPAIASIAARPEVSGTDAAGNSLAKKRGLAYISNALDEKIAANIENYLLTQFSYTLDLTDTKRRSDQDPLVQFLDETKRGHCEYFAGAMVLMCQSLGIEARVVTGFKCDEYNPMIGRYIVRQSHAHAWVEVRLPGTGENWRSFDPTTGREYRPQLATGLWSKTKRLYDFLEYSWADSVVAYDRDRREDLVSSITKLMANSATQTKGGMTRWDSFLPSPSNWWVSPILVGAVMVAIGFVGVMAVLYFAWERWRLRRRADRIGLGDLPDQDKIRLARQLGFYDELLRMLEQRGFQRPRHQTPMEFTHDLTSLPSETYDTVHRLTRIYYRIRYGRAELAPDYHRRIRETLARLEPALGPTKSQ